MRFLIASIGTAGDVFPLIGIGRELKSRGHDVLLASLEQYRPRVAAAGLEFCPVEGVTGASGHPDFYHPTRGMNVVAERVLLPALRPVFDLAARFGTEGWTIVTDPFCYGARIASETHGCRLITCVVSPFLLRSIERMPVTPGIAPPPWAPAGFKRAFSWFVSRLWDRQLGPELNRFRREMGLPNVSHIFYDWSLSPSRVVGLFPAWFAPRAGDWPAQFVHGGFTVYDRGSDLEIPPDLGDRERPLVVFSAGSAGVAGKAFFSAAIEASRGRPWRAVLLGAGCGTQEDLPPNVTCRNYVPLSRLLPSTAAIVFHGGLGTMSLALAAGVPQVVVPFGHDQHDNAARVQRLGVARLIDGRKRNVASALAKVVDDVLQDVELRARARSLAPQADVEIGLAATCNQIELGAG